MTKRRAEAIVEFPGQAAVVASVATMKNVIVLSLGDGRREHYTYPADGRFHITPDAPNSAHSFFAPGPPLDDLDYRRLAIVAVPIDPSELARPYKPSLAQTLTLPPPTDREGILEVGILGRKVTPPMKESLEADGAILGFFQGPRSDTTIVFRYTL